MSHLTTTTNKKQKQKQNKTKHKILKWYLPWVLPKHGQYVYNDLGYWFWGVTSYDLIEKSDI